MIGAGAGGGGGTAAASYTLQHYCCPVKPATKRQLILVLQERVACMWTEQGVGGRESGGCASACLMDLRLLTAAAPACISLASQPLLTHKHTHGQNTRTCQGGGGSACKPADAARGVLKPGSAGGVSALTAPSTKVADGRGRALSRTARPTRGPARGTQTRYIRSAGHGQQAEISQCTRMTTQGADATPAAVCGTLLCEDAAVLEVPPRLLSAEEVGRPRGASAASLCCTLGRACLI